MFKIVKGWDFHNNEHKDGNPEKALERLEMFMNNAEELGYDTVSTPVILEQKTGHHSGSIGYLVYTLMFLQTPSNFYETYLKEGLKEEEDNIIYEEEMGTVNFRASNERKELKRLFLNKRNKRLNELK